MIKLLCWMVGHVWWEHWRFEKVDRCIFCATERVHPEKGCTCTFCRLPSALARMKQDAPNLNWDMMWRSRS